MVLLAVVVLTSMLTSPTSNKYASPALRSSDTLYTEIISPKLGFGTSKSKKDLNPEDYGECIVKPARVPPHPVTPTFTASYPGSGAKMTWNLIGKFLSNDDTVVSYLFFQTVMEQISSFS